jgi:hypothetical protein
MCVERSDVHVQADDSEVVKQTTPRYDIVASDKVRHKQQRVYTT